MQLSAYLYNPQRHWRYKKWQNKCKPVESPSVAVCRCKLHPDISKHRRSTGSAIKHCWHRQKLLIFILLCTIHPSSQIFHKVPSTDIIISICNRHHYIQHIQTSPVDHVINQVSKYSIILKIWGRAQRPATWHSKSDCWRCLVNENATVIISANQCAIYSPIPIVDIINAPRRASLHNPSILPQFLSTVWFRRKNGKKIKK